MQKNLDSVLAKTIKEIQYYICSVELHHFKIKDLNTHKEIKP